MRARWIAVLFLAACGDDDGGDGGGAPDAAMDPNAPTCAITTPATMTKTAWDTQVMFTATASDVQDGALGGASIVWRSDLLTAPLGSGVTLAVTLPVGTNAVTCVATDSSSLVGVSAPVTVISKSPFAKINHPSNGDMRLTSDGAVPFVGIGRDLEDGSLSDASLAWSSSIDGALGTGGSFNQTLTAGTHTITLTVTDSDANTDTDSITLTMQ